MAKYLYQALEHWDGDAAQNIQVIADRELTLAEFMYQWYHRGQGWDEDSDLQEVVENLEDLLNPERMDDIEIFILDDSDPHELDILASFPSWVKRIDIQRVAKGA